jgi:hypothetical protein
MPISAPFRWPVSGHDHNDVLPNVANYKPLQFDKSIPDTKAPGRGFVQIPFLSLRYNVVTEMGKGVLCVLLLSFNPGNRLVFARNRIRPNPTNYCTRHGWRSIFLYLHSCWGLCRYSMFYKVYTLISRESFLELSLWHDY